MATATQVMPHMGGFESERNVNDDRKDDIISTAERSVETGNPTQQNLAKPPKSGMRHCTSSINLANALDVSSTSKIPVLPSDKSHFLPNFHSGSYCEQGPKRSMEDKHLCIDNILQHLKSTENVPLPGAFYGVFDGHNGTDAASFTKQNILKFITEDEHFPSSTKKAVRNAFTKADHVFADASSVDVSSGTTVLIALILGRTMVVANAGDSRAVLSKRGRAVELSKDHKPNCTSERQRIEKMGGMVYDGYLNGQLSVARALGDWHLKGPKGSVYPLSCEPELQEIHLTEEDEFLILGCDGLWDVMSNQCAVTMVRNGLMQHNDSTKCCEELVAEALRRNTCDNLTVVVVCFSPGPPPKIEIPRSNRRRSISDEGIHVLKGLMDS